MREAKVNVWLTVRIPDNGCVGNQSDRDLVADLINEQEFSIVSRADIRSIEPTCDECGDQLANLGDKCACDAEAAYWQRIDDQIDAKRNGDGCESYGWAV